MKSFLGVILVGFSLFFIGCSEKNIDVNKTIQRAKFKKYNKIALVIGNKNYRNDKLIHTIEDAKKMKKFLFDKGFAVIYKENVKTKEEFIKLVNSFLNQTAKNGVSLFYFSGHGISVNNENFLIPIHNSHMYRESDVSKIGYRISHLLQLLENRGNPLNIVMLDNCRNTFYKGSSINRLGLIKKEAKGVYIAYSTQEGSIARDNGLFVSSFVKNANISGWDVEDVFKGVRKDVYIATNKEQIPFSTNGTIYDYYFTPKKNINHRGNNDGFWSGVFLTLALLLNLGKI